MATRLIDLTGMRFGRLTVLRREGTWKDLSGFSSCPTWLCRCDCGEETVVIGRNLKSGMTRSCGCLRKDRLKKRRNSYVRMYFHA